MTVIEEAAKEAGLAFAAIPVKAGTVPDEAQVAQTRTALATLPGPVVGYCRSGTRAAQIWALAEAGKRPAAEISRRRPRPGWISAVCGAGSRVLRHRLRLHARSGAFSGADYWRWRGWPVGCGQSAQAQQPSVDRCGRALERAFLPAGLDACGRGVFQAAQTRRKEADVMPKDVVWVRQAAKLFRPDVREVVLGTGLSFPMMH